MQRRIESLRHVAKQDDAAKQDGTAKQPGVPRPDAWLAPIRCVNASSPPGPQPSTTGCRASDKGCLPLSLTDYLQLVDWTGRQIVRGRGGASRPTCRLSYRALASPGRLAPAGDTVRPAVPARGRRTSHARASDSPRCAAPAPSIPTGPRGTARPTLSQPAGSRRNAQNLRHARNSTTAPEQKAPDETASHSPATRRNHRPPIPLHPPSHPATIDAEVGCHRSWVSPGSRGVPRFPSAAVRIDPAKPPTPDNYADEVPHVHKEIVPT